MYFIVRKSRGRFNEHTGAKLQEAVDDLLRLFDKVPCQVFLIGGLGMAVQSGSFYRFHKDVDLALFKDDLPMFIDYLLGRSYRLVRNFFMTHISKYHDLYGMELITLNEIKQYESGKIKLRGLKAGNALRPTMKLADLFDIFLLEKEVEGIRPLGYQSVIPFDDFYPLQSISEYSNLLLPNIRYKQYLPARSPKQQYDMEKAGMTSKVAYIEVSKSR